MAVSFISANWDRWVQKFIEACKSAPPPLDAVRHARMASLEDGGPTLDQKIAHAKRTLAVEQLFGPNRPVRRETITTLDCFPSSQCPR